jgi:predicted nucleotidyltransferase
MIPTIEERREAVAELCREFNVERLDIFGSAATDQPDVEVNDLDFLVEFGRGGTMSPAQQYFGLLSALQRLFGREVDLLTRQSLRNPYFIRSVERTRRLLYAA